MSGSLHILELVAECLRSSNGTWWMYSECFKFIHGMGLFKSDLELDGEKPWAWLGRLLSSSGMC